MSVQSAYCRAGHPIAAVFGRVVIVDDDGMAEDGGRAAQRQVCISEEAARAGQLTAPARHGQRCHLVNQVAHLTLGRTVFTLASLVHAEKVSKSKYTIL